MTNEIKKLEGITLAEGIISGSISIVTAEMKLTVKDVFDKPLIRSVFKTNGEIGFTLIETMVKRFAESFGFSSKLSPNQIETLTVDILEAFNYETIEDVIIFLKMCRSGKFGVTGKGLDSNLVLGDWFPKYMELKASAREGNYEKEKSKQYSRETSWEDVCITYEKVQELNKLKEVKTFIKKITETMDRQMLEDTIIDWENDEKKKPYIDYLKRKRKEIN